MNKKSYFEYNQRYSPLLTKRKIFLVRLAFVFMVDFISVMAADGKLYERTGMNGSFFGCLGVCLSFSDPESYKQHYLKILNQHYGFILGNGGKNVIKSHDIKKWTWQNDQFLSSMKDFVQDVCTDDVTINVVFSTFNPQILPDKIKMYGTNKTPEERIDVVDFLKNKLHQYYPYITAWKVSKSAQLHGSNIYLDHFSLHSYTHAWNELCSHHSVFIYPHGDACNAFISSADIITRYIDEYLNTHHLRLEESSIRRAFRFCDELKINIFYVGHPDIRDIVPLHKEPFILGEFYPNPMIYLIREGILGKEETNFIENSPAWTRLLNYANSINGSVKYLDFQKDSLFIKKGDILVYFDSEGEKKARYIRSMLYEVDVKSIESIQQK